MNTGRVEGIFIAPTRGDLPTAVERVEAHAGKGLEGNRYYYERGAAPGRALTLIAAEALEAFTDETGIALGPDESRRNVLTRGVDVNALVGKRFRVGDVECEGVELCEPCRGLQAMTRPGVLAGMVHRAGLNADILSDGEIAVGDAIVVE